MEKNERVFEDGYGIPNEFEGRNENNTTAEKMEEISLPIPKSVDTAAPLESKITELDKKDVQVTEPSPRRESLER